MYEGLILFNQIWVPAIIYTSDKNGEIFHRGVIRPSEEMIEGGHAGKQLLAVPNEHVKINRPITAEEAMNYKEEEFAGRVQPPVSLKSAGGGKKARSTRQSSASSPTRGKISKKKRGNFFS